jgi:transposase
MACKAYPSDISDEEGALVAPYVILMSADAPQQEHSLRVVCNGLRWIVRAGTAWHMMPHDLLPWYTVSQQSRRWCKAGVFEDMVPRPACNIARGTRPHYPPLGGHA